MHRMPFGKYRGRYLHEIPLSYLGWVFESVDDISPVLRAAIQDEIRERLGLRPPQPPPPPPPPPPSSSCRACLELRSRWLVTYRKLVMLLHPDRGGSHDAMVLVNEVNEWFMRLGRD